MSVTCILMELLRNVCNGIIVVVLFRRVVVLLLETGGGGGLGQVCQASDQANLGLTFGREL